MKRILMIMTALLISAMALTSCGNDNENNESLSNTIKGSYNSTVTYTLLTEQSENVDVTIISVTNNTARISLEVANIPISLIVLLSGTTDDVKMSYDGTLLTYNITVNGSITSGKNLNASIAVNMGESGTLNATVRGAKK